MKYVFCSFLFFIWWHHLFAQKPSIDTSTFDKWPSVSVPDVSTDGNYALYVIHNKPTGGETTVIRALKSTWRIELRNATNASFTSDGRKLIFITSSDSMSLLTLGTSRLEFIAHAKAFKLFMQGETQWLAYRPNDNPDGLILRNFVTKQQHILESVLDYYISPDGRFILLQQKSKENSKDVERLNWLEFNEWKSKIIWKGNSASNLIFDNSGTKFAFISIEKIGGQPEKCVWYYQKGSDMAKGLIKGYTTGMDSSLEIYELNRFSKDGNYLYASLKEKKQTEITSEKNGPRVDVWSYIDPKLQSQQLYDLKKDKERAYAGVINIQDQHVVRLEGLRDQLIGNHDDLLLLNSFGEGDYLYEWDWNKTATKSVFLISAKDGTRQELPITRFPVALSPTNQYVIYYDPKAKNYFSYEIHSGIARNITQGIETTWTTFERYDEPYALYQPIGIAGFLKNDSAILIYDQNDIWKVDPSGNKIPSCLTNRFGRTHNIVFRIATGNRETSYEPKAKLILNAFSRENKDNGFYCVIPDKAGDPQVLSMGPYIYAGPPDEFDLCEPPVPITLNAQNGYITRRMSSTESPNYFFTTDFKTFMRLTDVKPEKDYNWLTTELIKWKTLNGTMSQGILYKPENFDPQKKYPIIFHYYERKSDMLHYFIRPEAMIGDINIPYLVSKGYLVFTPDIHYIIGEPGESAYNSIVSAANYLSVFPWVDSKKMGLQGHSFGGFETDYVVTHTNIFSAACSASGWADFIGTYNEVRKLDDGTSRQSYYEFHRERMGATLWQRPDLYIKNSPVFNVNNVNTPLLMMNNKNDGEIFFDRGVEFFTALRRAGKKVWMLQYDGEGHMILDSKENQLDFTIRTLQFFDHYLEGAAAPKWMIQGIPAHRKGMDNGLELAPNGTEPGPGLLSHDTGLQ